MILVILLSIVIAIIFTGCVGGWETVHWEDVPIVFMIGIFGLFFGSIISFFVVMILNIWTSPFVEETTNIPLLLMTDGSDLNGQFSLFGGYVDEEQVYNYYVEDSNGATVLRSLPADSSVIYQDAESPYLKQICEVSPTNWYTIPTADECDFEFHIPKDSIKNTITLDGN